MYIKWVFHRALLCFLISFNSAQINGRNTTFFLMMVLDYAEVADDAVAVVGSVACEAMGEVVTPGTA